jgi:hypothetical protein
MDSHGKKVVMEYLSGGMTMEELINALNVKEDRPSFEGEVVE